MKAFNKILCYAEPLEHAETALQRALDMAASNGAQLTLASLVAEIPIPAAHIQQSFVEIRQAELTDLLGRVERHDVPVDIQVGVSNLGSIELIKTVIRHHYDLLIKPTDSTGHGSHLLFGHQDQRLLRKCPVPVWIVKPQHKGRIKNILAAIDVDPEVAANAELNGRIVELARSLAELYQSKLHVVHAWHMYGEDMLRGARSQLPEVHVDLILQQSHDLHRKWLESFLGQSALQHGDFTLHMEKGEPAQVIAALVEQQDIDLTIMGTVARTGIPGFIIGNTAEKILGAIDCSVLAIKPGSFTSPIIE